MKAVEDGLRRLDGVESVRIDLQKNLVSIEPDPGLEFDLAEIPEAIRESGFTPRAMRLTARGEFVSGPESGFRIAGWSRVLPVAPAQGPSAGSTTIEAKVGYEGGRVFLEPEESTGPGDAVSAVDARSPRLGPVPTSRRSGRTPGFRSTRLGPPGSAQSCLPWASRGIGPAVLAAPGIGRAPSSVRLEGDES